MTSYSIHFVEKKYKSININYVGCMDYHHPDDQRCEILSYEYNTTLFSQLFVYMLLYIYIYMCEKSFHSVNRYSMLVHFSLLFGNVSTLLKILGL